MVQAKIDGHIQKELLIFMPGPQGDPNIVIDDSTVEPEDGNCMSMIVENRGHVSVHLKKGTTLGDVSPCHRNLHPGLSCQELKLEDESRVLYIA